MAALTSALYRSPTAFMPKAAWSFLNSSIFSSSTSMVSFALHIVPRSGPQLVKRMPYDSTKSLFSGLEKRCTAQPFFRATTPSASMGWTSPRLPWGSSQSLKQPGFGCVMPPFALASSSSAASSATLEPMSPDLTRRGLLLKDRLTQPSFGPVPVSRVKRMRSPSSSSSATSAPCESRPSAASGDFSSLPVRTVMPPLSLPPTTSQTLPPMAGRSRGKGRGKGAV
mmetsp:Transcript_50508/g.121647  ORF Transcript_50508/g.121647 Transcript_50508/m.121647 type:complete len:225 (-) Transcript_50508:17-691(-)